jgi:tetratricopeptide (TPR) repeat protein
MKISASKASLPVFCFFLVMAYGVGVGESLRLDSQKVVAPYLDQEVFWSLLDHTFSTMSGGPLGRPVSMTSFLLQWLVSEDLAVSDLAAVNIFLHCALFVAIVALLQRVIGSMLQVSFGESVWVAVMSASLWAALPIHASTVLYIVQRMTILAAFFSIISLTYLVDYLNAANRVSRASLEIKHLVMALACFFIAVFSKENAVTLVPVAAVLFVLVFCAHWSNRGRHIALLIINLLIATLLSLGYLYFRDEYTVRSFTIDQRLGYQLVAFWIYLKQSIFPSIGELGIFHDDFGRVVQVNSKILFLSISGLIGLVILQHFALMSEKWRLLGLGVTLILYGHLVETTVVPLELFFEHRNYFPSVGLAMITANFATRALSKSAGMVAVTLVFVIVFCMYSVALVRVVLPYQSDVSFAINSVTNHPLSPRAHADAAAMFARYHNTDRALYHLERFVELEPLNSRLERNILRVSLSCVSGGVPLERFMNDLLSADDSREIKNSLSLAALKKVGTNEACLPFVQRILQHLVTLAESQGFDFPQLHEIALLAFELEEYEMALDINSELLEANPNHAQSLFMRMHLSLLLQYPSEAREAYEQLQIREKQGYLGFYQERLLKLYGRNFDN